MEFPLCFNVGKGIMCTTPYAKLVSRVARTTTTTYALTPSIHITDGPICRSRPKDVKRKEKKNDWGRGADDSRIFACKKNGVFQCNHKKDLMHPPGVEPGPIAWKAIILPLDQECFDVSLGRIDEYNLCSNAVNGQHPHVPVEVFGRILTYSLILLRRKREDPRSFFLIQKGQCIQQSRTLSSSHLGRTSSHVSAKILLHGLVDYISYIMWF